jgi:hypothetical protein
VAFLVPERVGESLDGEAAFDCVAAEVQRSMDFDELHRAVVLSEDRERGEAEMFAVQWMRVAGDRRNRRWTVDARAAVATDDVFRFDAWPHHDA